MALILHYPFVHQFKKHMFEDQPLIGDSYDKDVAIITSFTNKEDAVLIRQLEKSSIPYINAVNVNEEFNKAYKPIYYLNALKNVTSEYSLIIDSYDTVINGFDGIKNVLNHYNKKVLYCAWNAHFPNEFDVDFGVDENNMLKYINSGVVFGKTEDVKKFYEDLSKFIEEQYEITTHFLRGFEQYWVYRFLVENPEYVKEVGIDYDELLTSNIYVS
jgi:hypothetical protein